MTRVPRPGDQPPVLLYAVPSKSKYASVEGLRCNAVSSLECRRRYSKQTHLRYEPRARISTRRRKIHRFRKRVPGDGHGGIVSVFPVPIPTPAHLILVRERPGAHTKTTQRHKEKCLTNGTDRVGDSDHCFSPRRPRFLMPSSSFPLALHDFFQRRFT